MLLITTWFGSFIGENGKVKEYKLFPKDPKEIAIRLDKIDRNDVLDEELVLLKKCDFIAQVYDRRLSQYGKVAEEKIDINPEEYGFDRSLLQQSLVALGSMKSRETPGEDFHIIQALRTIESINESTNLLSERVRYWYSMHFPELERLVSEEKYVSYVSKFPVREDIAVQVNYKDPSIGSPMQEEDINSIRSIAKNIVDLVETKEKLEKYIAKKMQEIAPNVTYLTGPIIGAKLIAITGGLGKLASKPSSTVQLLGAENALFRHLTSGVKPPKHGVIFQHPYICGSPRQARGKIARSFAGAISIAAKVDYYKGTFIADKIKVKLEKRIQSVSSISKKKNRKG